MATEEEIAAAQAAAAEAQANAQRAADEAAQKAKAAEEAIARAKAELPAVNDLAALARKAAEDVAAVRAELSTQKQREADAALLRHVRDVMHYEGSLEDEDLLAALRRRGADPSTAEGREKLELFREKHHRDFRARTISPEKMAGDLATSLAANEKIKNNPFFSIERGMRSLGRKS